MTVMDIKKTQASTSDTTRVTSKSKRIRDFIGDIKSEIEKINWTSKEELQAYTKIIVIATFIFGLGIYLADLFIQFFLQSLANFVRLIGG